MRRKLLSLWDARCIGDNKRTGITIREKNRYEIFAEPDPGSLLALKSGNSSLEAGMNVYLNGGFEVQKGVTFYVGIDAELMSEADRGCRPARVNLANVYP